MVHASQASDYDADETRGLAQQTDAESFRIILKRSWGGEVRNVSVFVAIGVGTDGHRQILGVAEGEKEDLEGWRRFLQHLKDRGLSGVRLIISDACRGLAEARQRFSRKATGSAA